ncbi:hypothetical protein G7Z17_g6380 [Cylindrodendrum hubeiense]|uniref:Uncharacterized protein n=1 Tax=Cylindrodendrum hubeiense TaxID=595255 RepID=A0A9P5H955_9HYPO|nr:hypothetical protein G7Z17_g6380 [Cylindrodendrum hubeiense]
MPPRWNPATDVDCWRATTWRPWRGTSGPEDQGMPARGACFCELRGAGCGGDVEGEGEGEARNARCKHNAEMSQTARGGSLVVEESQWPLLQHPEPRAAAAAVVLWHDTTTTCDLHMFPTSRLGPPRPSLAAVGLRLIADQPAGRPPERKSRDRQEPDWAMWLDARRACVDDRGEGGEGGIMDGRGGRVGGRSWFMDFDERSRHGGSHPGQSPQAASPRHTR